MRLYRANDLITHRHALEKTRQALTLGGLRLTLHIHYYMVAAHAVRTDAYTVYRAACRREIALQLLGQLIRRLARLRICCLRHHLSLHARNIRNRNRSAVAEEHDEYSEADGRLRGGDGKDEHRKHLTAQVVQE